MSKYTTAGVQQIKNNTANKFIEIWCKKGSNEADWDKLEKLRSDYLNDITKDLHNDKENLANTVLDKLHNTLSANNINDTDNLASIGFNISTEEHKELIKNQIITLTAQTPDIKEKDIIQYFVDQLNSKIQNLDLNTQEKNALKK